MFLLFFAFFAALIATALVIHWSGVFKLGADDDLTGPQKIHASATPRLGGLGIILGLICATGASYYRQTAATNLLALLLCSSLLAFFGGVIEDFTKKVSPRMRLLATCGSAYIAIMLLDAVILRTDINTLDQVLRFSLVSTLFTVLAVGGLANAVNIVDGFNGLATMVSVMMFGSMSYVAWQVGDMPLVFTCLSIMGATLGFFVWNFPKGLIFLGDGGAYLLGFLLAECAILLVHRNMSVSPWYAVLLLIYPIFETLFSIYRRKIVRGTSPTIPDGVHLHMLIFRRIMRWTAGKQEAAHLTLRNSMTSPYLWLLCAIAVFPASVWWNNTGVLIGLIVVFCLVYIRIYLTIIRFRIPKWMVVKNRR